jgi:nucleoside-diphosphate-sugar epimerase
MIVCVTGARGFIGRHLVDRLRTMSGVRLRVLSRIADSHEFPDCQVHRIDLTESGSSMDAFLAGADVLVHCAGEIREPAKMKAVHVHGTAALLEAAGAQRAERAKPLRWVQLSSVGVYGPPSEPGLPRVVTEDAELNPVGEYEQTKAAADRLLLEAGHRGMVTPTIIRPSIVFGTDMPNPSLRQLAEVVRRGLFFYIGHREAVATYIHVGDVIDVLVQSVFNERMQNEVYNVSNDCSLEEMIGGMATGAGVRPPQVRLPEKPLRMLLRLLPKNQAGPLTAERFNALVGRTSYPFTKLTSHIGYKPACLVPQALASVVSQWFGSNGRAL